MSVDRETLIRFLQDYPFQPATAFWRAVEVPCVLANPFPSGYGLDLGCGDGKLMRIIMERVGMRKVVGVDMDYIETAQAAGFGIYEHVYTTAGDDIPESDRTFDWVFSNSVLEHVLNILDVIREAARILKPGGLFIFTVPGVSFHDCLRGPILPWVDRSAYLHDIDSRLAHRRYWGSEEWCHVLNTYDLAVEACTPYLTREEVRRWETIARLTAGGLWVALGKTRSPVQIQRMLALPKATAKMPVMLARFLSSIFLAGMSGSANEWKPLCACLYVRARKTSL